MPEKSVIVEIPEKMNDVVSGNIRDVLSYASFNQGKINDSSALFADGLVEKYYQSNGYKSIWSSDEKKNPLVDSLTNFIQQARYYGLFPADYHESELKEIQRQLSVDSNAMKNAMVWTQLDLLSTDAFFMLVRDLKEGRLADDSISILSGKNGMDTFFYKSLKDFQDSGQLANVLNRVEPHFNQYDSIRYHLRDFVDNMDTTRYIYVSFPYKDSLAFIEKVYARLLQEGIGKPDVALPDSLQFSNAVKSYQKKHSLEADGKIGPATVRSMNQTDRTRFISAAISLDRYKQMTPLPETYVWVNIPAFRLELWDDDTIVMASKVIVGKPQTPTPELTSKINNLVIYPNWTIPESIIKKDILPQLKKDPGYLARKGYNLFKQNGDMVDPYTVDWSKYKTGIPWKVVQGSGDDNALGIFKFNFSNPYSVYLHDTNQRYLFANSNRALSHGCVRVQKWQQLANFIANRDSAMTSPATLNYSQDSIQTWVRLQERKSVMVRNRLPLYIVYFTCSADNGKLEFYDDIYNSDQRLAEKYFKRN